VLQKRLRLICRLAHTFMAGRTSYTTVLGLAGLRQRLGAGAIIPLNKAFKAGQSVKFNYVSVCKRLGVRCGEVEAVAF
jgi:hypothetical protein